MSDYYDNLPHPSVRPKVLPPPPDTPHERMTVTTYNTDPGVIKRRSVRRGREALVVIYQNTTVAYCPREGCTNVELVTDDPEHDHGGRIFRPRGARPSMFHCSNCWYVGPLEWPDDYERVAAELERRPVPQTRNWYPEGHPWAVGHGIPDGQSVAELRAEAAERGVI